MAFAADLRQRYGGVVADVRLSGYTRGGADEDSDVDVAVVLEHVDWDTYREVIDRASDIGLMRDLIVSPTIFDRSTWERWQRQRRTLAVDIERDGIPL